MIKKIMIFEEKPTVGLCRNVVVSEWCCVGMALCRNGVVSEWRGAGMALCRNGDMSGYILSGDKMSGVKHLDDPHK